MADAGGPVERVGAELAVWRVSWRLVTPHPPQLARLEELWGARR